MKLSIKQLIAKLPLPFWLSFYIFLILIAIPTLAYIGTFGKAAPGSLTVTIDQKQNTNDPNPSYTSVFTVQFNEAIDKSTFTDSDITLGGTAPGQQIQSITEAGTFNKTTYEVRIQATGAGTIIPTIAQEVITAQNGASGTNQVSNSTDNSVTYNGDWAPGEFILRVKTDNTGISANDAYTTAINSWASYNYNVDCGNDGSIDYSNQISNVTCTFGSPGTYDIAITGTFPHMRNDDNTITDTEKVVDVKQWSNKAWADMGDMFSFSINLTVFTATDIPDLSNSNHELAIKDKAR